MTSVWTVFRRWPDECFSGFFFFSSRRRHTRYWRDWSSDVCSSDLGSSGSSAGSGSAVAAGLVPFALGTETLGSILSPSTACGVTGLRPTFGRVSRAGCMTLSWTQDRVGPICRTAEDCAIVFAAIARTDEEDPSVIDLPFNWEAEIDVRRLKVGYLRPAFEEPNREADWKQNDEKTLQALR